MPPRVRLIAAFSCGSLVGLLALGCSETNEPRGKNAVTVADMQEKGSAVVEPRPKPSAAALAELLAHYDPRYDPAAQMLRVVIGSPSDHSQLPPGTVVHPTRESLIYALALLERDDAGDATRAMEIVRRVVALQDADPSSPTFGVWSWHAEEPLAEMSKPDLNWADFCGVLLAQMLVQHVNRLPAELRDQMRTALGRAAEAIRRRDIGAAYTNIAIVGGSACAAAGELLDNPALLEYGRRRLRSVVRHAAHHGISEYNSPNYTRVAIAECERALQIVRDGATREAAESLRRTLWQVLAESFHQPTQQIAGPHSRSSSDRLRPREIAFLSQRIGVPIRPHPAVIADRAICHSGERRAFHFDEPLEVVLAAAIELLRADEPVSKSLPSVTRSSSGSVTATWPVDGRPPLRVSSDRPPQ